MEKTNQKEKIENFTQLTTWQEAHKLAIMTYKVTRKFPKEEMFGLTSQLRRSCASVAANIAEGFGRQSAPDKLHFYTMARGSLTETQNHVLLARDIEILLGTDCAPLLSQAETTKRLLHGLMKSIPSGRQL